MTSMTADHAITVICDLVLRERIRFARGDLAQAHIDLGSALRDLFSERVARCPHCHQNAVRVSELIEALSAIEEELGPEAFATGPLATERILRIIRDATGAGCGR